MQGRILKNSPAGTASEPKLVRCQRVRWLRKQPTQNRSCRVPLRFCSHVTAPDHGGDAIAPSVMVNLAMGAGLAIVRL